MIFFLSFFLWGSILPIENLQFTSFSNFGGAKNENKILARSHPPARPPQKQKPWLVVNIWYLCHGPHGGVTITHGTRTYKKNSSVKDSRRR